MRSLDGANEVWFYKGQLRIDQPKTGYRAGFDAAQLAASIDPLNGTKILDLGCGTAAIMLMLDHRLEGLRLTGLENDATMLSLATFNTKACSNIEIAKGSVDELPKSWHLQFDQVVSNPPYFDEPGAVRMSEAKAPSFVSRIGLGVWIGAMLKALKPRGYGSLIYRADGLDKILGELVGKVGDIRILPIHSYADEPAKRVLVRFRKGVKNETVLLPSLIIHDRDGEDLYGARANQILCGELPIDMGRKS